MSNLLRVSEAASLGLHTMALLAVEPEKLVSAKEAATLLGVSEAHLAKVLQRLARAGLVDSVRGPKGGFTLTRPAEQISLLEIYEAIDGPIVIRNCLFSTQLCNGEKCIFGNMLESVDRQVQQYLANTKLTEVVETVQPLIEGARKSDANA